MVNKLNVIMKYNRSKSVWICPDCDTENELDCENCFTCDHVKPSYARIITPESERQEMEEYVSVFPNTYNPGPYVSTPTYGSTISPPIHYPSTYGTKPKKSSAGAVIAVIVLLLIIIGIIGLVVAYDQGYFYLNTFNSEPYSELLADYTNTI